MKASLSLHDIEAATIEPAHVAAMLSYASPRVRAVQWDADRQSLAVDFGGSEEEWRSVLARLTERLRPLPAARPPEVVYAHRPQREPANPHVWDDLIRSGLVRDFGHGHVAYRGLFRELVEWLDACLRDCAVARGAEAIELPNMVPVDYALRAGAFEQHAQDLFFAAPLVSDCERIEAFQQETTASGRAAAPDALAPAEYCLKTSACALLYPALENTAFSTPAHYTMLGSCTRHESKMARAFERLTEFRMREIVFLGDEAGADDFERFSLELFRDLIESFDLRAEVRTANDSFFLASYGKYRFMQRAGKEKYEARVWLPDGGVDAAFGSFNHHRRYFGRRFGLSYRGEVAVTACTGFGLERLAYGILSQLGIERESLAATTARFRAVRAARGRNSE